MTEIAHHSISQIAIFSTGLDSYDFAHAALRTLNSKQVLEDVESSGCTARVATRRLAAEEAPQSYKDVSEVVQTCHKAGISTMCVRLKPLICVKG
jgi:tRNA-splicing ligase RtcB